MTEKKNGNNIFNETIQQNVENNSLYIENIVMSIADKYTKELDNYMRKIKVVLEADSDELTDEDLNRIMINLCSYAYFMCDKQELVGIRQDISEALRNEKYNNAYMGSVGTVASKTAQAENTVKEEDVISLIYSRAYKILKSKYDSVNRYIDAVKKIISHRIQAMSLGAKS